MTGTLNDTLRNLRETSGLDMLAVVGSDGLPVDSSHAPDLDSDSLSALAASGLLMMDAMGQELQQGTARQAILEFDQSLVVLTPLDEEMLLVAVARGEANLGRIRLVLRRALSDVSAAVGAI